jgi:hypothetical protein
METSASFEARYAPLPYPTNHEVENARVLRERSSDPPGPEFCAAAPRGAQRSVNRGIGGLGIELRKLENQDADVLRINGRQHGRERKREPPDSPA